MMRDFKKLHIWQKSHELTLMVYKLSEGFPKSEVFGLQSQLRRSVSSVPTNIAEGCGRESKKEFERFLAIASGSVSELLYQLLLCFDLKYINEEDYKKLNGLADQIQKMLYSYMKSVRNS